MLFFTFGEESAKVSDAEPANQRLFFYCPLFQSGLANILSKSSSLSTVYAIINRAIYGLKIVIITTQSSLTLATRRNLSYRFSSFNQPSFSIAVASCKVSFIQSSLSQRG